jgi:hypothetical protein
VGTTIRKRTVAVEVDVDQNLMEGEKEGDKEKDYPVLIATGRAAPAGFARQAVGKTAMPAGRQQYGAGSQEFSAFGGC